MVTKTIKGQVTIKDGGLHFAMYGAIPKDGTDITLSWDEPEPPQKPHDCMNMPPFAKFAAVEFFQMFGSERRTDFLSAKDGSWGYFVRFCPWCGEKVASDDATEKHDTPEQGDDEE